MSYTRITRYGIVRGARSTSEVEAYLPDNYRVLYQGLEGSRPFHVIEGKDSHGWSFESYVQPRLASGLMGCEEIGLDHPVMRKIPA